MSINVVLQENKFVAGTYDISIHHDGICGHHLIQNLRTTTPMNPLLVVVRFVDQGHALFKNVQSIRHQLKCITLEEDITCVDM